MATSQQVQESAQERKNQWKWQQEEAIMVQMTNTLSTDEADPISPHTFQRRVISDAWHFGCVFLASA